MQWKDVNNELPEWDRVKIDCPDVWMYVTFPDDPEYNYVTVGFFDVDGGEFKFLEEVGDFYLTPVITHWQYANIPEPPK